MKVYVAGKITGLDREETLRKFERARKTLEETGFSVLVPTVLLQIDGMSQADYLHVCFAMIDVCDAVVFLPDWKVFPGALKEMEYLRRWNKKIYFWENFCPCEDGLDSKACAGCPHDEARRSE